MNGPEGWNWTVFRTYIWQTFFGIKDPVNYRPLVDFETNENYTLHKIGGPLTKFFDDSLKITNFLE